MRLATRGVVGIGLATVIALLALLAAYTVWALHHGIDERLIALDVVILAAGHAGLTILIAVHVREMVMHRVGEATAALQGVAEGRYEQRVPEDGPREVQELLSTVNIVAEAAERRQRLIFQESSSAAMADVLLGVSHEIRNPLASMRISASMLREWGDQEAAAAAGRVLRGVDRLEEMVLTLEEVGRAAPRERVDPNRIARGALMAVQGRMLHLLPPRLELEARQQVRCNPAHVMQAITAIVANAIEASPASGHLTVRTRDEGDKVAIEVEDAGPGIAAELGEGVFEAFVTTKPGHAGLGLTLARQVLEAQGASLLLESSKGVRAVVRLPADPA